LGFYAEYNGSSVSTFRNIPSVPTSKAKHSILEGLTLNMETIRCPETSICYSHSTLHEMTKVRRFNIKKVCDAVYACSLNRGMRSFIPSCLSGRLSLCLPAWNNSAPTRRISIKTDITLFIENLSKSFILI